MLLTIKSTGRLAVLAAVGVACVIDGPAFAQAPQRGEPVALRARPDYDAQGVRAGSFIIRPSIGVSEMYNDNIFSTQTNEDHDFITAVLPELLINSDWNNHALNFRGTGDVGRYARSSGEDYEDYSLSVDGKIDIRRDMYLDAGISYSIGHEDRGSPDDVNGVEPTKTNDVVPRIGFFNKWNRVSLKLDGTAIIKDFDDVALSTGAITNNDDRDRTKYKVTTRLGYEIQEEYEAFVEGSYNTIDYDDAVDDAGVNRDSDGFDFKVGARLDLSGIVTGDVSVGYLRQDYDAATLETISGPTLGAALTWNVTSLTTLKGNVERFISETTQGGTSGSMTSKVGVLVDHELLRNLLVGGNASGAIQKYRGNGREDDIYEAGLYAKYLINRNFRLDATYDWYRNISTDGGESYSQNKFLVKLTAQY